MVGFWSGGEEESDPREVMSPVKGKERKRWLWGGSPSTEFPQGTELWRSGRSSLYLLPDEENDLYMLCYLRNSKIL